MNGLEKAVREWRAVVALQERLKWPLIALVAVAWLCFVVSLLALVS